MKTVLRSIFAGALQAIQAGFRAYFTFSERDARILASAYGFPPPEIEDLRDGRPYENAGRVSMPGKMMLSQRLAPPYPPILPGMHPELTNLSVGVALRKRLHM